MGVTIHYRGKINSITDIDELTGEAEDFARELGWESQRWNEDWSKPNTAKISNNGDGIKITGHAPLRGINLYPHDHCEPFSLTFNPDGYLISLIGMTMLADGSTKPEASWMSTKTQFAPIEIHITIIKLLKYIKGRYIHNLEIHDDGGYWESGDINELKYRREAIDIGMDIIEDALSELPREMLDDKTPEETAEYIEKMLKERFGEK